MTKKNKVLFMLSGSIACYKACEIISQLAKREIEVQTAVSKSALEFIGKSSLEGLSGKPVFSDEYEAGRNMDHIHLMHKTDLIILCPATAKTLNQFASGSGDMLTTLFLAHDFKRPFLIYPAMNHAMYEHPVTQQSIRKLRDMGIDVKDTEHGDLACGESGFGRLLEPQQILEEILEVLK